MTLFTTLANRYPNTKVDGDFIEITHDNGNITTIKAKSNGAYIVCTHLAGTSSIDNTFNDGLTGYLALCLTAINDDMGTSIESLADRLTNTGKFDSVALETFWERTTQYIIVTHNGYSAELSIDNGGRYVVEFVVGHKRGVTICTGFGELVQELVEHSATI